MDLIKSDNRDLWYKWHDTSLRLWDAVRCCGVKGLLWAGSFQQVLWGWRIDITLRKNTLKTIKNETTI